MSIPIGTTAIRSMRTRTNPEHNWLPVYVTVKIESLKRKCDSDSYLQPYDTHVLR